MEVPVETEATKSQHFYRLWSRSPDFNMVLEREGLA
jgi:hypothetical protein